MLLKAKAFSSYQTSSTLMGSALINSVADDGHTSTSAVLISPPFDRLKVTGSGLTYDDDGFLIDGTITKIEVLSSFGGAKQMVISGMSFDIGDVPSGASSAALVAHPVWKYDGSSVPEIGLGLGASFRGEGGNDTLSGGEFDDEFRGEGGNDLLVGLVGHDTLEGGSGKDSLDGGADGDFLFGGKGNDTINGGKGADMVVSNLFPNNPINADQTINLDKGTHSGGSKIGVDKLISIESFFSGNGDDTITGSSSANTLLGAGGDDVINGKSGGDEIWMGDGHDIVTGGRGADLFVFDSYIAANSDVIKDFKPGTDRIGLANSPISFLGDLPEERFHAGEHAQDEDDFVIYNQAKGKLFVDLDGNGSGEQVLIATISGKPALTTADFEIVGFTGDWWLV